MPTNTDEPLDSVVESLNEHISTLRMRGWGESAQLLEIAKLDLQLRLRMISDGELRAFCSVLASQNGNEAGGAINVGDDPQPAGAALHDTGWRPAVGSNIPPPARQVRRSRNARRQVR